MLAFDLEIRFNGLEMRAEGLDLMLVRLDLLVVLVQGLAEVDIKLLVLVLLASNFLGRRCPVVYIDYHNYHISIILLIIF